MDSIRYEVTYTPDSVGDFQIEVFYDNMQIDNSPFTSRAFDIQKVMIDDFPSSAIVGSSSYFMSK
jgi:hypothetical protein